MSIFHSPSLLSSLSLSLSLSFSHTPAFLSFLPHFVPLTLTHSLVVLLRQLALRCSLLPDGIHNRGEEGGGGEESWDVVADGDLVFVALHVLLVVHAPSERNRLVLGHESNVPNCAVPIVLRTPGPAHQRRSSEGSSAEPGGGEGGEGGGGAGAQDREENNSDYTHGVRLYDLTGLLSGGGASILEIFFLNRKPQIDYTRNSYKESLMLLKIPL